MSSLPARTVTQGRGARPLLRPFPRRLLAPSGALLLAASFALAACGADSGGAAATSAAPTPVASQDASFDCSDPNASEQDLIANCEGIPDTEPPAVDTEGSMKDPDGQFVKYPDGLTARLVTVERLPADMAGYTDTDGNTAPFPSDHTLIRAQVELSNAGTEPAAIEPDLLLLRLYSGPERYEATADPGYSSMDADTTDELISDNPQRVVPGRKVTVYVSWDVPDDQLSELAVTVNPRPDYYTDYTFADAQILLK